MARMPLKFRSTGVAFSSEETSKDCTAWSGGWTIGYIYYKAPEEGRDEPLTWIWSIHGVPGKPPGAIREILSCAAIHRICLWKSTS